MHETALVRLPHLHQAQEDDGEGNFAAASCFALFLQFKFFFCSFSLFAYCVSSSCCADVRLAPAVCGGHRGAGQADVTFASHQSSETDLPGGLPILWSRTTVQQ